MGQALRTWEGRETGIFQRGNAQFRMGGDAGICTQEGVPSFLENRPRPFLYSAAYSVQ
jgi:hypothetical protein